MIDCLHCGAGNKEESKFCGECGERLDSEPICPMCGTGNLPENTLCSQCGARMVPLAVPPSEEELEPIEEEGPAAEGVEEEDVSEPPDVPDVEADEIEEITAASDDEDAEPTADWLEKLRDLPSEEVPVEAVESRLSPGQLPDWLEIPPEFEEMLSEMAAVGEGEGIERAEIPSWLEALRPGEDEAAIPPEESAGPAEATGLLRGIEGTLPVEPLLTIPRRAGPLLPVSPSAFEAEHAQTFDTVARTPPGARAEIRQQLRVGGVAANALRWVIYLVVAVAVVVPTLLGSNWTAANIRVTDSTLAMYDAIQELHKDTIVLISHDYGPGEAAEMIPQAKAVLNHLMDRQVRLINVSLTPEGPRLSQQVMEEVADAHGYVYGEDHLNLGYVVGAAVGPRSLIEDFPGLAWADSVFQKPLSEFPLADEMGGIEDVALVVEFAGGPEYLRLWLEQVQGPYQLPMVAGVSATADPFARPYYNNQAIQQLQGLMSGLVGAAEYESHSGQPGSALASMDSQSLVHVTVALLVVFGNVAYFGSKLRRG